MRKLFSSKHEGAAGRDRGPEDLRRFVSPRLCQMLGAVDPAAREELWGTCSDRLRRSGPESLKDVLAERLEELPGSFYPVYNTERQRWELGIR